MILKKAIQNRSYPVYKFIALGQAKNKTLKIYYKYHKKITIIAVIAITLQEYFQIAIQN